MQKSARKSYISGKTRFEVGGQSVRYLASRDVLTKKSGACLGRMEVFVSEADRDHYRSNLTRFEKTGERVRVARTCTALDEVLFRPVGSSPDTPLTIGFDTEYTFRVLSHKSFKDRDLESWRKVAHEEYKAGQEAQKQFGVELPSAETLDGLTPECREKVTALMEAAKGKLNEIKEQSTWDDGDKDLLGKPAKTAKEKKALRALLTQHYAGLKFNTRILVSQQFALQLGDTLFGFVFRYNKRYKAYPDQYDTAKRSELYSIRLHICIGEILKFLRDIGAPLQIPRTFQYRNGEQFKQTRKTKDPKESKVLQTRSEMRDILKEIKKLLKNKAQPLPMPDVDPEAEADKPVTVQAADNDAAAVAIKVEPTAEAAADKKGKKKVEPQTLHVQLVAHYALVDITTFDDSQAVLRSCIEVGGKSFTQRPIKRLYYPRSGEQRWGKEGHYPGKGWPLSITIRDTYALAAEGSSLAALGECIGIPKIADLPKNAIKHMDRLLEDDPEHFMRYALTDAVIALKYAENFSRMVESETVELREQFPSMGTRLPVTAGNLCVEIGLGILKNRHGYRTDDEIAYHVFGMTGDMRKDLKGGAWKTRKVYWNTPTNELVNNIAIRAFRGGLNDCSAPGLWNADGKETWFDVDLCGAYATAMAVIRDPVWDQSPKRIFNNHEFLEGDVAVTDLGAGFVSWTYPPSARRSAVAVDAGDDAGLVCVLEGENVPVMPIEIWALLKTGAKVWTEHYVLLRQKESRAFGEISAFTTKRRNLFPKGSPKNTLWKLMGNSLYGKTAQGLKGYKAWSLQERQLEALPLSKIASPLTAATTTAIIRTMLTLATHQIEALGYKVISRTTDGFITNFPQSKMEELDLFGMRDVMKEARRFVTGEEVPAIWEPKHLMTGPILNITTRTNIAPYDRDGVLAKGGLKPTDYMRRRGDEYIRRRLYETYFRCMKEKPLARTIDELPSGKDYQKYGCLMADKKSTTRKMWRYDNKHRITDIETVKTTIRSREYTHFKAETSDWHTVDEFKACRDNDKAVYANGEYRSTPEVIKRIQDIKPGGIRRKDFKAAMACARRRDPGTEPLQEWTWQQWAEAATALDLKATTANDFAKAKSAKGLLKPQDLQRFINLIAGTATVCDMPPKSDKTTANVHAVIPIVYVIPEAAETNLLQTYKQACCNISRDEHIVEPLQYNDLGESYKPLQDKALASVRQLEYNCLTLTDENTCNDKGLTQCANLYLGKEEKNAHGVPPTGDTQGRPPVERNSRRRTPLPAEKWGRHRRPDRAIWALRASAVEKRRGTLRPIIETMLRRTPQLVFEGSALRWDWLVPENKNTAPP